MLKGGRRKRRLLSLSHRRSSQIPPGFEKRLVPQPTLNSPLTEAVRCSAPWRSSEDGSSSPSVSSIGDAASSRVNFIVDDRVVLGDGNLRFSGWMTSGLPICSSVCHMGELDAPTFLLMDSPWVTSGVWIRVPAGASDSGPNGQMVSSDDFAIGLNRVLGDSGWWPAGSRLNLDRLWLGRSTRPSEDRGRWHPWVACSVRRILNFRVESSSNTEKSNSLEYEYCRISKTSNRVESNHKKLESSRILPSRVEFQKGSSLRRISLVSGRKLLNLDI
jgi:hypothetical protein